MTTLVFDQIIGGHEHHSGHFRGAFPHVPQKTLEEVLATKEKFAYMICWRHTPYKWPTDPRQELNESINALMFLKDTGVIEAARDGRCKIVLLDWYEGIRYSPDTQIYRFHDKFAVLISELRIPPKNLVYVDANAILHKDERPNGPRIVYENYWLAIYNHIHRSNIPKFDFNPNKPFRYLSYARHWNSSRQYVTFDLFNRDLIQHGLVSCGSSHAFSTAADSQIRDAHNEFRGNIMIWNPTASAEKVEEFLSKLPMTLDADLAVNQAETINHDHHRDSDISLLQETHMNPETVFLSEKTVRALMLGHPFLMMSSPGTIAEIRRLGFYTYSHVFDERYDQEMNVIKRRDMVIDELEKYIKRPDRATAYKQLMVIAEYNQKKFFEIRNTIGRNLIEAL
jgi:hypothetical protein